MMAGRSSSRFYILYLSEYVPQALVSKFAKARSVFYLLSLQSDKPLLSVNVLAQQAGGEGQGREVAEFVDNLKARLKEVERGSEWTRQCEDLLKKINSSLDPNVAYGQELLDIAGGSDLLEVVVQYAGISEGCEANINTLIANMAASCDPREMFTIFFEVINIYTKPRTLHLCIPLLHGLSIVFPRIRRRQVEFFKEAIPGLLEVGRAALEVKGATGENDSDDEVSESRAQQIPHYRVPDNIPSKLVEKLVNLGKTMREVYTGDSLASCSTSAIEGGVPEIVMEVMNLLSSSNLFVKEILTTRKLEEILDRYSDEDEDQILRTRFEATVGAALAVYWYIFNKDSSTVTLVFDFLKSQVENSGRQGVSYVINMASILLVPLGWNQDVSFQQKGVTLLTSILEVLKTISNTSHTVQPDDSSIYIMPALKRIQDLVVHTANTKLRREAYALLIKVSLLLNCVKDEVVSAWPPVVDLPIQRGSDGLSTSASAETFTEGMTLSPFVNSQVLQFIQCVLRTRDGDLAELPRNIDAVVSALNLYRFLLIRESSGNTNYTQVLGHDELVKGRTYWLLPIREQALSVRSVLERVDSETDSSADMMLAIDCLQSVLYRCLEIVEEVQRGLPN
ncbi:hypothetical protein AXG93_115s1170 [Marchantia polymorpha subsp. ruderalis]|uniref:Uncharacterized protein n=1 Tax=Marchantia polymorpha subsp. ruderalis TaxID=1480154 RepID=A0A176W5V5_MARPO|nr:hypothetical protein AXG93_115s1170 [Marchantia polymorpha subsp. ruderalis]